ncbi:MAG: PAC2 family protein [Candidatus Lokiarchaeota archaeon]|nr:PAC2 family protein [Candidatus Lokiarchaeota archaeon]
MNINITQKFELNPEDLNDPVVLIGWPGIALVAQLAIISIKDSIDAKEFLDIEYFDFPPKSNVEKGKMEIPSAKVYFKSRKQDNKPDLFILTANYQPQTSQGVFEFSQKFCEEMDKLTGSKIKMYISAGAMVTDRIRDAPMVHVCGTNQEIVDSFLKSENTILMDVGVIAGANGILPAWAGKKGYAPGVCLLAETLPLPMMALDPRASKALLVILKDYFDIDMNFDELNSKIDEMEHVLDTYKKQANQFMNRPQEDRGSDSYFR